MELHGDDWKDEWDDAGRKRGWKIYGWQFWAIATVAACAVLALVAA